MFLGLSHRVPEFLTRMDVYVLPSVSEGISNSLLEAMASGIPAVATAVGGNPEVIVDGESGLLFPVGDLNGWRKIYLNYAEHPELRRDLAMQAIRRVREEFSIEAMVREYQASLRGFDGERAPVRAAARGYRSYYVRHLRHFRTGHGERAIDLRRRSRRWRTRSSIAVRTTKASTCGPGLGWDIGGLSIIDLAGGHQPLSNEDEHDLDRVQRRDLQLRGTEPAISVERAHVPDAIAIPKPSFISTRNWARRASPSCAACSPSPCGTAGTKAAAGPRPHGQEAAVLFLGRPAAAVRFGDQGAVAGRRNFRSEIDLEALLGLLLLSIRSRRRRPSTATCASCARRTIWWWKRSGIREVPYWDIRASTRRSSISESRMVRRVPRRVPMRREIAAGQRRSAGRVSQRRRGFVVGGRVDERVSAAGDDVLDRLHRGALQRGSDARAFATTLGANHHEQIVEPHAIDLIAKLAWHYDEPFADSSAVPTYYVSQIARRHVTVALSGRWRRRELRRLPPLQARRMWENQLRSYLARCACAERCSGRWAQMYPKLGWAPRVFRAKIHAPEPGAFADGRLFLQHVVLPARHEAPSC